MSEIPDPPKTTGSIPRRSPQDEHPMRNRAVSMSSKKPTTSSTPAMAPDHSSQQPKPGSCALRLENLEQQTSAEKGELMVSIAADICATFISIAKYSEDGTLQAQHTGVIDNVIQTIRDTDVKQRHLLDRQVRRLRKERNWVRKKYSRLVGQADALGRAYQTKMRKLRISLREAQAEVARLQNERDILRAWLKKNVIEEGASDGDVDGEFEVDEGEDVDGEYENVENGDGN
ncbi:Isopropylmalate dehydrogenase [Penicillium expansum]|nr:Isopropylmalate dehydrogenase [Penicillium expansum]